MRLEQAANHRRVRRRYEERGIDAAVVQALRRILAAQRQRGDRGAVERVVGQQLEGNGARAAALAIDGDAASAQIAEPLDRRVLAHEHPDRLEIEARERAQLRRAAIGPRAALDERDVGAVLIEPLDIVDRAARYIERDRDPLAREEVAIDLAVIEIDVVLGPGRHDDVARRRRLDEMISDGKRDDRQQDRRPVHAEALQPGTAQAWLVRCLPHRRPIVPAAAGPRKRSRADALARARCARKR